MKKILLLFMFLTSAVLVSSCKETSSLGYTVSYYYETLDGEVYELEETKKFITSSEGMVTIIPETKEGFTFNEQLSVIEGDVTLNNKPEFFIYYDRNVHEVIFYVDGLIYDTYEVKYGQTIQIDNPFKTGYEFTGWEINQSNTYIDLSLPIYANYSLNAIFESTEDPIDDPYDYTGYYEGANNLYGEDLVDFLHEVISTGFDGVTYGEARYMLDDTDQDPDDVDNVILVYLGTSVSGVWDAGNTWNREHVWPQSFLGVDADNNRTNSASDLHNLKPSDPGENTSRSNKYFGNETTYDTYEPRDEVKGDIARILFYMDIMYNELSLIEANEGDVYEMGNLDVLLEWHELDPVDDFERNRNNLIYSYQKNRNPFIDHPEFVNKIYGDEWTQTTFDTPYHVFTNMIIEHDGV